MKNHYSVLVIILVDSRDLKLKDNSKGKFVHTRKRIILRRTCYKNQNPFGWTCNHFSLTRSDGKKLKKKKERERETQQENNPMTPTLFE